eukprot:TRINITY_DN16356_c0_g4_i2.p1 TRINITY_DN16356_c0_g4~~TRINITY_DN16356_c0_g4_i2.p1  ORF type:complete len:300 (-),score=28.25 TRINITY_DN16356_c0_g4_i2:177-1076(-)
MSHLTRRRLVVCFFALIAFLRAKAPSFYLQSVFLPHASSRLPASQFSPIARGRPGVVGMRTMKTDAEPHSAHPRKLIGALQGKRYSSDDWSPESASEFGQLLEAFPHILAVRLGVEPNPNNKLSTILEPDHPVAKILDEARSAGVRCSPNYLVYRMRQCVHNAFDKSEDLKIPHWQMLTGLDRLVDCIGGCERLLTTPVPYAYSRHTSRFLTLWCGSLPFILVSSFGWQAVPIVAFICWALFSLEEIGHLIENPFNMFSMHTFHVSLPIDRISADCGKEVRDVLDTYATLSSANDAPIV